MTKVLFKLTILFLFLILLSSLFIFWQRSTLFSLFLYKRLQMYGVHSVDVEVGKINFPNIEIKRALIKGDQGPFLITAEMTQANCSLIFSADHTVSCHTAILENMEVKAENTLPEEIPSAQTLLNVLTSIQSLSKIEMLETSTKIKHWSLLFYPYQSQRFALQGDAHIDQGKLYSTYQLTKSDMLELDVSGNLDFLTDHTNLTAKTKNSEMNSHFSITETMRNHPGNFNIESKGKIAAEDIEAVKKHFPFLSWLKNTQGSININRFSVSSPLQLDSTLLKNPLFQIKSEFNFDVSTHTENLPFSEAAANSDFNIFFSADNLNIEVNHFTIKLNDKDKKLTLRSTEKHLISWNGSQNWHFNFNHPITWQFVSRQIEKQAAQGAAQESEKLQGIANNVVVYTGENTHIQFTLLSDTQSNWQNLLDTQTATLIPAYRLETTINKEEPYWLLNSKFESTKDDSKANLSGEYHIQKKSFSSQLALETNIENTKSLLQKIFTPTDIHSAYLFHPIDQLIEQLQKGKLTYSGKIQGQLPPQNNTLNFEHQLEIKSMQSNLPWLNWDGLSLSLIGKTEKLNHNTGEFSVELKQSHLFDPLTKANLKGEFSYSTIPKEWTIKTNAQLEVMGGQANTENMIAMNNQSDHFILPLKSQSLNLNELFNLNRPSRYTLNHPEVEGMLYLKFKELFQLESLDGEINTKKTAYLTDKPNSDTQLLTPSQFNFSIDTNNLLRLTLSAKNEGSAVRFPEYTVRLNKIQR